MYYLRRHNFYTRTYHYYNESNGQWVNWRYATGLTLEKAQFLLQKLNPNGSRMINIHYSEDF